MRQKNIITTTVSIKVSMKYVTVILSDQPDSMHYGSARLSVCLSHRVPNLKTKNAYQSKLAASSV